MLSHPEKVLFPDDGITKAELAGYYASVAPRMLPHLRGRPVTLERFPSGIGKKGFMQKDVVKGFPDWLERVEVPKHGGTVHHVVVSDERALLWLANQNCITPHVWPSRQPQLFQPDLCVFDLDPAREEPEVMRAAVLGVRGLLAELGLPSFVKTSGSKGFHVLVPLLPEAGHDEVAAFSHRVGAVLAARDPEHLTQEFHKAERGGRIFVDVGRSGYSATFAAPYAVRARKGAPVSAPCSWEEVEAGRVGPATVTLRNCAARMAAADPWAELEQSRAPLAPAHERLQRLAR